MPQYIFRPWTVLPPSPERPSRIGVCGSGGEDIYDAPLTNETEAKAHLIAAAPDLLDACKKLIDYRNRNTRNWQTEKADDFLNQMRIAITKAEGRP